MGNVVDVSDDSLSITLRDHVWHVPGPVWGAEYGVTCADRGNQAAGWSQNYLDIRGGTIRVALPKPRHGAFFPD